MSMMEFDGHGKLEFSAIGEIRSVQEGLLRKHLRYLAAHSPYYRSLFKAKSVDPEAITLDALHTLPLTDKTALGQHNEEFLAVPRSAIVDMVLSSGTTGRPTTMMYTENDLRRLAYTEELSLESCRFRR